MRVNSSERGAAVFPCKAVAGLLIGFLVFLLAACTAIQSMQSSTSPVYRAYNTTSGNHFWTASESERNSVLQNQQTYRDEGVAFRAYASQVGRGVLARLPLL